MSETWTAEQQERYQKEKYDEWNHERCVRNGGNYQYRVLLPENYAVNGEIYLFAERVAIESGVLVFYSPKDIVITSFAAGTWNMVHVCSAMDATPTNIYYWETPEKDETEPQRTKNETAPKSKAEREPIGDSLRFKVFEKSKFRCSYCGKKADQTSLEIDHIVPVSKGGTNDINNLQAACRRCNQGKSNNRVIIPEAPTT